MKKKLTLREMARLRQAQGQFNLAQSYLQGVIAGLGFDGPFEVNEETLEVVLQLAVTVDPPVP